MRANFEFTVIARAAFLGEQPESDSAICPEYSDLRRLLHHRLEVLKAALLEVQELKSKQPKAHPGNEDRKTPYEPSTPPSHA